MIFKKFCDQLNILKQCRKYNLSLWQCPQFLFLIMGIIIVSSSLATFAIGNRYVEDPLLVALIVIVISLILLIVAAAVVQGFERLAEANRMKSEFVSVVSHQLHSPIANLKWVIEFLMSGKVSPVSPKQAEYLSILKENSQRMGELVSDLLVVSRIEQGKFLLSKERIFLQDLIEEVIKETEIFIKASNVRVIFNRQEKLPQIMADGTQFKLVLGNLLDNAVRYIVKNGKININLEKRGRNLYFTIEDNGAGIPKEDQKYIFQKFFRSKNAIKEKTEGSGLGLYIAKSIIEKAGGKIGFKSQEGLGSTFWFTIPIK